MSRRNRHGSLAGLTPAQIAALLLAADLDEAAISRPTAVALQRHGYLEPSTGIDADAWAITDRGRGAASVLRAVRRRPSGDNQRLSPKRPYRETPTVVQAVCRMIVAVGKRVAEEDTDGLQLLLQLQAALDTAFATAVEGLRSNYSDGEIGRALGGLTKQAVQKRWPRTGRSTDGSEERS